jgi:hypothetical protein
VTSIGVLRLGPSLLTLALCSALGAAPVSIPTSVGPKLLYSHSYALIIAEAHYKNTNAWNNLDAVVNEAKDLSTALDHQGFDDVQIKYDVLGGDLVGELQKFIHDPKHRDNSARLIIYYAGHGDSEDNEGYLVPVDAPARSDPDFYLRAVQIQAVRDAVSDSTARHTLLLFDSCFSGLIFDTRGNPIIRPIQYEALTQPRIQVITAGDGNQTVPAQSEFLPALLRGIRGDAAIDGSGMVTATELGVYLSKQVHQTSVQIGSIGRETTGEFTFLPSDTNKPASVQETATVKEDLTQRNVLRYLNSLLDDPSLSDREKLQIARQIVNRPLFAQIQVVYFKKRADGDRLTHALEQAGIPFEAAAAKMTESVPTNMLSCSVGVDIDALRKVAHAAISAGISLRLIGNVNDAPNKIALGSWRGPSSNQNLQTPPLTVEQIDGLGACPQKHLLFNRPPDWKDLDEPPYLSN